jgi:hypothetical protein
MIGCGVEDGKRCLEAPGAHDDCDVEEGEEGFVALELHAVVREEVVVVREEIFVESLSFLLDTSAVLVVGASGSNESTRLRLCGGTYD